MSDNRVNEMFGIKYNKSDVEIALLTQQIEKLKSENAELENSARIVQAELKRQYDRVDALMAENKLLSERVKEQNDIIDSWKKQYQILCDKHYAEKDRLTQNIQSIRSELNITRDERDVLRKLFTEWHEKAISMRKEILELRKAYSALKADHETVHVTVRCGRCK